MKMEMDIIDEQVDTVGRVFMGLTLGCARCHDHKFDPIPTADYYALAGIFKSTKSMQNHKVVAMWNERALATDEGRDEARGPQERGRPPRGRDQEAGRARRRARTREDDLRRLRDALAELQKQAPPIAEVMGVEDQAITNLRIHVRGNHLTLGEEVPRRFPRILAGENQPPLESSPERPARAGGVADRRDHPLTARVMVNRLWLWHFGEGLVGSPDNFGRLGDRPVNLDLLDWLARRFVASGWSIKAMHRLIMLSSTYQMSTPFRSGRRPDRSREPPALADEPAPARGRGDPRRDPRRQRPARRDDGRLALTEKNHAYVNSTHQERRHGLSGQPPLGLPAGDPQRPVRRLPGVRLRRSERVQRQTHPDDRRPAGAVHDERPAGLEMLGGDGSPPARSVPVSTTRAGSVRPT